jgi:hypothetical protein
VVGDAEAAARADLLQQPRQLVGGLGRAVRARPVDAVDAAVAAGERVLVGAQQRHRIRLEAGAGLRGDGVAVGGRLLSRAVLPTERVAADVV